MSNNKLLMAEILRRIAVTPKNSASLWKAAFQLNAIIQWEEKGEDHAIE